MSSPVDVLGWQYVGMQPASGVSGARAVVDEWPLGTVLSSMSAHGDASWKVANGLDVAKTGLFDLGGSSTLLVGASPRAADVGFPSVVPPEAGLEVSSIAQDKIM